MARPIGGEGVYRVDVWRANRVVAFVQLLVSSSAVEAQAVVECASLERAARGFAADATAGRLPLRPNGWLVVHAADGEGYSVTAHRTADGGDGWDSRTLREGDVFSLVLLRPGAYQMVNATSGASASLRVIYPDPRSNTRDRVPLTPAEIRLSSRGFEPDDTTLRPGQGIIVRVGSEARIVIRLTAEDDGPPDLAEWRRGETDRLMAILAARRTRKRADS